MPLQEIPGYTARTVAAKQYGRSKSSFIRDFDTACERGDEEFLKQFRFYLKDGTFIEGPDATKEKIRTVQHLQPRCYIETAFLESRYWESDAPSKPKKDAVDTTETKPATSKQLNGADPVMQLRHELILEQRENDANRKQIATLTEHNKFLQEELTDRRKDMKELTELVDVMRKALPQATTRPHETASGATRGDDAGKKAERPSQKEFIDAQAVPSHPKPEKGSASSSEGSKTSETEISTGTPSSKKAKRTRAKRKTGTKKRAARKQQQSKEMKKVSWVDKHLPTFKRFLPRR